MRGGKEEKKGGKEGEKKKEGKEEEKREGEGNLKEVWLKV